MRAREEMNVRRQGHGRTQTNPEWFTGSAGPSKRHISLVSYILYDEVLCPGPRGELEGGKFHRQGGHRIPVLASFSSPAAYVNISSRISSVYLLPQALWTYKTLLPRGC